ncbi:MAG: hypothetical protein HY958_01900, partial [Bacteroidia bacterium]|nr:hypothetical protein [Bacteroidia bacterium]
NGTVTLTSGIVSTGIKILSLAETASFSPAAGSATGFIDGKVKKTGNNAAFTFPVGDIQGATVVWAPLDIAAYNNTNDFTVHYTYKSPYDSLTYCPTWNTGSNLAPTLYDVSGKEFWLIDRTGAGAQTPAVTLYWKDAVKSDILGNAIPNSSSTAYDAAALADLTLVHWNSSTSKWDDMGGTAAGTWPAGQITNSTTFSSYSPITFGSKTGKNPLPIELLSFTATCTQNQAPSPKPQEPKTKNPAILLEWSTATETNNAYFTIERSSDAQNWELIATVNGAGNSNTVLNYSYTDQLSTVTLSRRTEPVRSIAEMSKCSIVH